MNMNFNNSCWHLLFYQADKVFLSHIYLTRRWFAWTFNLRESCMKLFVLNKLKVKCQSNFWSFFITFGIMKICRMTFYKMNNCSVLYIYSVKWHFQIYFNFIFLLEQLISSKTFQAISFANEFNNCYWHVILCLPYQLSFMALIIDMTYLHWH